jgi:MFS family permease
MLVFFFVAMPWVNKLHFRLPLVLGFIGYIASKLLLIAAPSQNYVILTLSVFLEVCSFAVVGPLVDKLTALTIDAKERARILAIMYVVIILITAPFGWIAGTLSEIDKTLPFILCIALYAISAGLAYRIGTDSQKQVVPA